MKKSSYTAYLYVVIIIITSIIFYWIANNIVVPLFTSSALTNETAKINNMLINTTNQTMKQYNISPMGLGKECYYSIRENQLRCWETPVAIKPKEVPNENELYSLILYPIFILPLLVVVYLIFKIQ
jgi:hypothetical protein